MHKERTSSVGLSEKFVFDAEDIAFIKGDGAMFNKQMLADHFGVSVETIYMAMKRQPEMHDAYEDAKVQQKNMRKEIVSGHGYKTEKIVLDEKDIEFIRTDGAYLTVEELADYFEISHKSFYNVMHRQSDVFTAHQRSKTQKKLQYHKLADDKITGKMTDGDTSLLIFQLKTRCRMAEVLPESRVEDQIVETPEERAARMEDIRLFTQWKKERLKA